MLKNPYVSRAFGHFFDFVRFGEALRLTTDRLNSKNFYACNPNFDKGCGKQ